MLKKQKGEASVFILSIYIILILLVVCLYAMQTRLISHTRDDFDTGLLLSLLGTATINIDEYGKTGCRVIHETYSGDSDLLAAPENASCNDFYLEKAITTFRSLLQSNLTLDQNMKSGNSLIRSPVQIEEFKIYNVYEKNGENKVYEFIWKNNFWNCIEHIKNSLVPMPNDNNQEITETTLYVKIGFDIAVYPYFQDYQDEVLENSKIKRVYMIRTVTIPEN